MVHGEGKPNRNGRGPSASALLRFLVVVGLFLALANLTTQAAAPAISTQPQSQTALGGTNVSFKVTATGTQSLAYRWYFNSSRLTNSSHVSGSTSNPLGIAGVLASDAGNYFVTVSNQSGMVTSAVATLTVRFPPVVVQPPQAQTAVAGLTASFAVFATGAVPLTYQWQKDGADLSGATSSTLTLENVQTNHAGLYRVAITNVDGATNSASALLTVALPVCVAAPAGMVSWWKAENSDNDNLGRNGGGSPTSVTFAPGMVGQAFGFNGPNDLISLGDPESLKFTDSFSIESWIYIRAYPTPIYGNNTFFGGMIFARGDNTFCYDPYFLGVTPEGSLYFHIEDREQTLFCGQNLSSAPLSVGKWYHVGAVFDVTNGTMMVFTNGVLAAQTATSIRPFRLLIPQFSPGVGIGNYGNYAGPGPFNGLIDELAVYQGVLSEAQMAAIYHASYAGKCLVAPTITQPPSDQTVIAGTSVSFPVVANGSVSMSYQWQHEGNNLVNDSRVSGASTATLTLSGTQVSDAGSYRVVVTNLAGAATSAVAVLTVRLPPTIEASPTNLSLLVGINANFAASVSGDATLVFRWQKNGSDLSDDGRISGTATVSLSIAAVTAADVGNYHLVVTNDYGIATSADASLTVWFPPSITTPPVSQTVFAGTNAGFVAVASGTSPLAFQWRFNQAALPGATKTSLNLTNVQSANAGDYNLVATNLYGSVTSAVAALTVTPSVPWLTLQPKSLVASLHQPVSLSGAASGTEPLTVRWQREGVEVAGATNFALNFAGVIGSNVGNYRVIVSNSLSSVTSTQAFLAVVPVIAWGRTNYGATVLPATATNVVAMAAGGSASGTPCLAVRYDGTVVSWGYDKDPGVPADVTNAVAVAIGGGLTQNEPAAHNFALRADGSVRGWGANTLGQVNIPPTATNVVALAAGGGHGLALRADGSIVAWGSNSNGQTNVPPAATNIVALAAGNRHSLALRADGTALAWGSNTSGQTNVPPNATNLVALSATGDMNLALRADGLVIGWGTLRRPVSPLATNCIAVAVGGAHDTALRSDRTILAWGSSTYRQTTPPAYASNVMALAAGGFHNLALITDPAAPMPPRFVRPPQSRSLLAGQSLVLHTLAVGGLPLRYQWQRNGTPLAGRTTPWLALPSALPGDAGDYELVATNEFGAVTSAVTTVTVNLPPPMLTSLDLSANGFHFSFTSFTGATYVVEYKLSLQDPAWQELLRQTSVGAPIVVDDPNAPGVSRFYRVKVE